MKNLQVTKNSKTIIDQCAAAGTERLIVGLLVGIPLLVIASSILISDDLRYWPEDIPKTLTSLAGVTLALIGAAMLWIAFFYKDKRD